MIAVQETVLTAIQKWLSNVIIESNLRILIHAITGDIKAPSQISNIIGNIIILAKAIKNADFMYCNRFASKLDDKIAENGHQCTSQNIIIYHY